MGKTEFVERRRAPRPLAFRIQHLLLAVSTVLLGLGLGLTAASMWTSAEFSRASDHSVTMMNSMREHMTADMLHDGMRGVVYHADRELRVSDGPQHTFHMLRHHG